MTKYYQASCSKSIFEYTKKVKLGWIVRWNAVEHTEDERVVVTYNETLMHERPDYSSVASMLIHTRYSRDAELAIQRQRDRKPEVFAEYDAFCEDCKAEAKTILGIESNTEE